MNFDNFFQTELNEQQQKAVTHTHGPLLVIAGAGSGKTRVITARIAYLILKQQVTPSSILALTFTNKAAQEMRERINTFLGDTPCSGLFLGTFHAYCLRLLKEYGSLLNLAQFSIIDSADQEALFKKILGTGNTRMTPKQALATISTLRNTNTLALSLENDFFLRDLYHRYETEKKLSNYLDFDDLLFYGIKLFEQNNFKKIFRQRVRHILVDEYQDTNYAQHTLLKHMAIDNNACIIDSLCIVGDEDQAIYSWRGATIENIIQFNREITSTTCITIEQNYRSTKQILDTANHIITHNTNRHPKQLWSNKKEKNCVLQVSYPSDQHEAASTAQAITIARRNKKYQHIAVLYRAHFQSRVLEEALIRESITYKIIGGTQFYERKEIKDIIAYLRLVVNPYDRLAFIRAINCPPRALGQKFLELFLDCWEQNPLSTYCEIRELLVKNSPLKPQYRTSLDNFCALLHEFTAQTNATEALKRIIEKIGYLEHLRNTCEAAETLERTQNIKELINAAHYHAQQSKDTIMLFLQEVALLQETQKNESNNDPVQLMTLHAAKGLEFSVVFITGLEDGLFPSTKSFENDSNLEEERRLLYVGITRARNKAILSWAENRFIFGATNYQEASRFLKELPRNTPYEQFIDYGQYRFSQTWHDFFAVPRTSTVQIFPAKKMHTNRDRLRTPARFAGQQTNKQEKTSPRSLTLKSAPRQTAEWRLYQTVTHATFGAGIIQAIEEKADKTILTIRFQKGIKRIASTFVS